MEVKLVSVKKNTLLNRKEVDFLVETKNQAKTPSRSDIKNSIAEEMKVSEEIIFIKKMKTLTGSNMTVGIANIYDSIAQANLIEADHIKKRNIPQKIKEEETKE
jgi:ribosomal protein S24E